MRIPSLSRFVVSGPAWISAGCVLTFALASGALLSMSSAEEAAGTREIDGEETPAVEADETIVAARAFAPSITLRSDDPGFVRLGEDDFVNVNCEPDTWTWKDGVAHSTGKPIGVLRTKDVVRNFELLVEWRHLTSGGNSGVFVWASPESIAMLERGEGRLPHGIEVQVLDHGYTAQYESQTGKKADWFTTHGDVFPTGPARMKPFPPVSPNGERSFPSKERSKPTPEWNQYYIRAINGEVRLWVNGEEVSGGTECKPATGYLCLESEGAPVEFRNIFLRVLP